MRRPWWTPCVAVALLAIVQGTEEKIPSCTTPKGTAGRCVPVRSCAYVLDILRRDNLSHQDANHLQGLQCGTLANGFTLVCCPRLVNEPECGRTRFPVRIIGGYEASIGDFPWLAVLRFQAKNGQIHSTCAGSLIGRKFVLTAAHCMTAGKANRMELVSVRLAEWNMRNHRGNRDCLSNSNSNVPICRKDFDIAKVTMHPEYEVIREVHINDIALIMLATEVEYSSFMAPICLPLQKSDLLPSDEVTVYTAAGWGATSANSGLSDDLMQIELREFDNHRCSKLFSGYKKHGVDEKHICAGGVGGEDTCRGDSGGPLMEESLSHTYLAGITSFGKWKCGSNGMPGVYTNVSHYLDWIEREVFRDTVV